MWQPRDQVGGNAITQAGATALLDQGGTWGHVRSDQTLETDTERNRGVKGNAKVFSLSSYHGRQLWRN